MPSCILSVERFLAPYRYPQAVVTELGARLARRERRRRGPAPASPSTRPPGVETRASVVPIEDVFFPGDFETQNDRYARDRAGGGRRPRAARPRQRGARAAATSTSS